MRFSWDWPAPAFPMVSVVTGEPGRGRVGETAIVIVTFTAIETARHPCAIIDRASKGVSLPSLPSAVGNGG